MPTATEVFDLALKHFQAGGFSQAEYLCRQILRADPSLANAWCFLGAVCQTQGKLSDAIKSYQQALRLKPDYAQAHYNLGLAIEASGQGDAAIVQLHQALACNPDYADAIRELERILVNQEQWARQEGRGTSATLAPATPDHSFLAPRPLYAQAHYNLGVVRARQGQIDAAIAEYHKALQLNPDSVETHNNLASVLHQKGRFEDAIASYHDAIRLRPDCAEAYTNLGATLTQLGRLDEAIDCYCKALSINPQLGEVCNNLGEALKELGQLDEAEVNFEKALRLKPNFPAARWNRSLLWLLRGEFAKGWPEYEWRWTQPNMPRRLLSQPLWDGSPLDGKTIFIYAEQGLGDTLQFLRYIPRVRERGGNVIVECQPLLTRLLDGMPGVSQVIGRGEPLPDFEIQAPMLSLPRIFGTSMQSIPRAVPYLSPASRLVEYWKSAECEVRSAESKVPLSTTHSALCTPQFFIGIAWQGSPTYRYDRQRSIPLVQFGRLAEVDSIRLVSLQKGPGTEQLLKECGVRSAECGVEKKPNAIRTVQSALCTPELDGASGPFMDTAALMKNLDLVICSDSAVAHLAGALAVPVWVALPFVPDWRWLLKREDSPWYPSMRLFRQKRFGDWQEVFERMAAELSDIMSST
jgi:tetratricopeptide (TPR) repeat protein